MDLNVVNYHQLSNALWGCEHGFFLIGENLETQFLYQTSLGLIPLAGLVNAVVLSDAFSNFWTVVGKEIRTFGHWLGQRI